MSEVPVKINSLFSQVNVKQRFQDMLGEKAAGFMSSVINVVNNNDYLQKADQNSVLMSAAVAASLDLPIDPNLGFSAIVPYGKKAQFQMMYKGFIQLAMRSGQYKTINCCEIYEGEIKNINRVTGEYDFDFEGKKSAKIIGYTAYFKLVNGFEKTIYWDSQTIAEHGKKYSKSYHKENGRWKIDFESMARKTVLKSLLSKWGILTIDMQNAIKYDQAVIKDINGDSYEYADNPKEREIDVTAVSAIRAGNEVAEFEANQQKETSDGTKE